MLTPDNWLITSAITIPANGLLQWAVAAQRPNYLQEHSKMYFPTTANAPSDFEILLQGNANLTLEGYQVFQNDELIADITDPDALELIIDIPASNGLCNFYAKTVFTEGVSVRSNEVSLAVQGVGVEKVKTPEIAVYPNPGKDVFYIRANEPLAGASIRVISMTNQLVYSAQGIDLSETQQHRIELANLPQGVYMIIITASTYQRSFKIVVQ